MYSCKLKDSEKKYNTMEKESLSIIKAVVYCKQLLQGSKLVIHTDNKNLKFSKRELETRVQRWKQVLNEMNCEIEYIPRTENQAADFLCKNFIVSEINPILNLKTVIREQYKMSEETKKL